MGVGQVRKKFHWPELEGTSGRIQGCLGTFSDASEVIVTQRKELGELPWINSLPVHLCSQLPVALQV